MTKVRLIDGALYDPWEPSGPVPSPATVAHGLANLNRYGGHTKRPYSVAEHSIWVAVYLACGGAGNDAFHYAAESLAGGMWPAHLTIGRADASRLQIALLGLVHDAPEGCGLVDVPGPITSREEMTEYKRAHHRCMNWLARGWGLPSIESWPADVKAADIAALGAEVPIRPDGAEQEGAEQWPELDLLVKHNLGRFGPRYIANMWARAFALLRWT